MRRSLVVGAAIVATYSHQDALTVGVAANPSSTVGDINNYVLDGRTTYCWKINAAITAINITNELIASQGTSTECPLPLSLTISTSSFEASQFINATWSVMENEDSASAVHFQDETSYSFVGDSNVRANIVHSNIHVCRRDVPCSPFTTSDVQPTINQFGNLTAGSTTTFTTNEVTADVPGTYIVLAHIIVPGETPQSRFDFAVFTQVEVVLPNTDQNKSLESTVIPAATLTKTKGLSKNRIIMYGGFGIFVFALLILVAMHVIRKQNKSKCMNQSKLRDGSDDLWTMESQFASIFPKHNAPTDRTANENQCDGNSQSRRSSEWANVYTVDGNMASSILHDDVNTLAILRASRVSTPSPSTARCRTVADFRTSIARWDTSVSGSPISPSSSELLFKLSRNSDAASSTPSTICFVPLEDLASRPPIRRKSKKIINIRSTRSRQPDCEDSGDEEEGDI